MQVPVDSIVIRRRVRKDVGDLGPLMESLKRCGQMNPIVLTRKLELIAGHRRLESARRLGWHAVEAVLVDGGSEAQRLEMELDENVHRKDLSAQELLDGYERLRRLQSPTFLHRMWVRLKEWAARCVTMLRRGPAPGAAVEPAVFEVRRSPVRPRTEATAGGAEIDESMLGA